LRTVLFILKNKGAEIGWDGMGEEMIAGGEVY